jgi:hypothetical protein
MKPSDMIPFPQNTIPVNRKQERKRILTELRLKILKIIFSLTILKASKLQKYWRDLQQK